MPSLDPRFRSVELHIPAARNEQREKSPVAGRSGQHHALSDDMQQSSSRTAARGGCLVVAAMQDAEHGEPSGPPGSGPVPLGVGMTVQLGSITGVGGNLGCLPGLS